MRVSLFDSFHIKERALERFERESPDSVTAKLRTAWRSPTLFVSRAPTAGDRRDRKRDDKGKRAAKYERHKTKQMLRRLE